MLFDLQGKRRRVIQGTYLLLAVLMGGGLVLFGVGSNVSGGLADIFTGGDSSGGGDNGQVQKRIDTLEKRVKANPSSVRVRGDLTRAYYQLANQQADAQGQFSAQGKTNLAKADRSWQAYLKVAGDKPNPSLASTALQIYSPGALNKTGQAKDTAQLIAEQRPSSTTYLNVVQYATLDKDTRIADLAGQKALDLAPASQKKAVRSQLKQIKAAQAAAAKQSSTTAAPQ